MIFSADQLHPFKFPGYHDPNAKRIIGVILRPPTWTANTVYGKRNDDDYDVFLPTVYNGFYFKVKNPGKSLATEMTYVNETGEETTQVGTSLIVEAVDYNLLPVGQNVSSVTVTGTHGTTISSVTFTDYSCQFMIDVLAAETVAAKEFVLTVTVVLDNTEQFSVELEFEVR
jgi:hypothetical protein